MIDAVNLITTIVRRLEEEAQEMRARAEREPLTSEAWRAAAVRHSFLAAKVRILAYAITDGAIDIAPLNQRNQHEGETHEDRHQNQEPVTTAGG